MPEISHEQTLVQVIPTGQGTLHLPHHGNVLVEVPLWTSISTLIRSSLPVYLLASGKARENKVQFTYRGRHMKELTQVQGNARDCS